MRIRRVARALRLDGGMIRHRLPRRATRALIAALLVGSGLACGDDPASPGAGAAADFALSGQDQVRFPGSVLLNRVTVQLLDADGGSLSLTGVPVTWEVTGGAGSVEATRPATSDVGQVSVSWRLGPERGVQSLSVRVEGFPVRTVTARAVEPGAIVFASNRRSGLAGDDFGGVPTDLWVMNEDGSDPVRLVPDHSNLDFLVEPAWSPDGTRVAYTRFFRSILLGLYGVERIGEDEWEVHAAPNLSGLTYRHPTWSPDGTQLAARFEPAGGVFRVRSDGFGPWPVAPGVGHSPDWHPDGDRIAFACETGTGRRAICTSDVDGQDRVQITDGRGLDDDPDYAPDGSRILFARTAEPGRGIWLIDADGSDGRLVVSGPASSPSWGPAGGRFVMDLDTDGQRDVWMVDLDTGQRTNLTRGQGQSFDPDWRR